MSTQGVALHTIVDEMKAAGVSISHMWAKRPLLVREKRHGPVAAMGAMPEGAAVGKGRGLVSRRCASTMLYER